MKVDSVLQTAQYTANPNTSGYESAEDFGNALQDAIQNEDDEKLKEACQEIEAYVIAGIYKQMKSSTEIGDPLIPKGDYEEMFEDYMIQEQAREISSNDGIGLATKMYETMSRQK